VRGSDGDEQGYRRNTHIRREDAVIGCNRFHISHNLLLETQIFENSFNDNITPSKVLLPNWILIRQRRYITHVRVE
jgi:hypothetical protein